MLGLEQTEIGSWNNARKLDRCGLREEYSAYYGRVVGVRQAACETTACGASAGARHPPRVTGFDSLRVQWSKSHRAEGETGSRSRMRPGLHAGSLGRPRGTA